MSLLPLLAASAHPQSELEVLRAEIKRLRERPCVHVVTTGTTSHCTLAERDARDAERYRLLRKRSPMKFRYLMGENLDVNIDAAIKEQADAPGWFDPNHHGRGGI